MSDIKEMLVEEIRLEIEGLKDVPMGTEDYKVSVDGLSKLVDKAIEMERLDMEYNQKIDENDLKVRQMEDEKKDRMVKNGLTAAGIIIPTIITIWGTLKSFKFEETGTVTTILGRGFINKLLPKK